MLDGLFPNKYGVAERYIMRKDPEDDGSGSGGGGGNPPESQTEPAGGGDDGANDGKIEFTKEQLANKIKGEKANAKKSALADAAATLGVSLEEAAEIIRKHNEAEAAKLSDAERAKLEAEQEKGEASSTKAQAQTELFNARIDGRIVVATGLDPDDTDDAVKIVRLRNLVSANLTVESTPDEIAAEFKQVKDDFPGLFEASGSDEGGNGGKAPDSDRGGPSRRSRQQPAGGGDSGFERGQKRAKEAAGGSGGYTFLENSR